jgi:hypothetical protein
VIRWGGYAAADDAASRALASSWFDVSIVTDATTSRRRAVPGRVVTGSSRSAAGKTTPLSLSSTRSKASERRSSSGARATAVERGQYERRRLTGYWTHSCSSLWRDDTAKAAIMDLPKCAECSQPVHARDLVVYSHGDLFHQSCWHRVPSRGLANHRSRRSRGSRISPFDFPIRNVHDSRGWPVCPTCNKVLRPGASAGRQGDYMVHPKCWRPMAERTGPEGQA